MEKKKEDRTILISFNNNLIELFALLEGDGKEWSLLMNNKQNYYQNINLNLQKKVKQEECSIAKLKKKLKYSTYQMNIYQNKKKKNSK